MFIASLRSRGMPYNIRHLRSHFWIALHIFARWGSMIYMMLPFMFILFSFSTAFSGSCSDAMGASTKPRLSGMQLQVLALYRGFLRAARTKSPEERSRIEALVSQEFRRNSSQVDRKNYLYIEYLVRRGKKQLDQLKSPETVGLASLNVEASQAKSS